ncbi:MAG: stage III sporulation protein AE [Oscillospiraceae bacterium]|jgi:stage III sporulation protein AE|nr:stage III sporulation protein AE [Oscillospiraceae bacterium]
MHKRLFPLLFLLFAILFPFVAYAEGAEEENPLVSVRDEAESLLDSYDLSLWQQTSDNLLGRSGAGAGAMNVRDTVLSFINGAKVLDGRNAFEKILELFVQSFRQSAGLMAALIVPALFAGILSRMRASFENDMVTTVGTYVAYLLVAIAAVKYFFAELTQVRAVVTAMANGMQALFPLLLTLLAAVGGTSSSAFFQPAIVAASGTMTALVKNVTMSLAIAAALVTALSHITPHFALKKLLALLKTVSNWSLGICFTVFIGVMAVQGFGAAAMDGVSLRTAKYAIDNFVPVVGGMFADTMDTLIACSLVVKNALGATGFVILVGACVVPLTRILTTSLVFRMSAAILEPVGDENVVNLLSDFAGVMTMLFTILLSVAAMFFLLIAQLILVGNLTVMLR